MARCIYCSKMSWLLAVCGILLAINTQYGKATLEIQVNGMMTNQTQFCAGNELLFTCTIPESLYAWVALPHLNGSEGNGVVAIRMTETVGNFTLTASGMQNERRSTLQVTAFPGLNGTNILCKESGGDPNVNQNVDITVLGPPSITVNTMVVNSLNDSTLSMTIPSSVTLDTCLQSINASLSAMNGTAISTEERVFVVDNSVFTASFNGLNLCDYSYNYTVMGFGIINTEPDIGDIAVGGTGDIQVVNTTSRGDNVTIILDVIFDDCPSSVVQVIRSDGGMKMINVGPNQVLEFADSEATIETCTVYVNLNSGSRFKIGSFECDIDKSPMSSTIPISMSTASTPPPPPDNPTSPNVLSPGAIAGIAVAGVVAVIVVLLVLIVGLLICCKSQNQKEFQSNNNVEMEPRLEYKPDENMPTYQAPDSIKREVASNTGDVYTVPETKKKAKSRPEEDAPTYSVVDKGNKKDENLVYADIDVKNPTAARSKRPPPPPGVTEHDANEPVLYSTLQ